MHHINLREILKFYFTQKKILNKKKADSSIRADCQHSKLNKQLKTLRCTD